MPLKKFLMWAQAQFVRQVRGPFRRHRGGPLRGAAGGRHGTAMRRDWCVVGSKNKWGMIKRKKLLKINGLLFYNHRIFL